MLSSIVLPGKPVSMRLTALPALLLLATAVQADPPHRGRPLEDKVCLATHIFIGTTVNYREISLCAKHVDERDRAACRHAEVDVQVEDVLWPPDWHPDDTVRYRYGGGNFNMKLVRADLETQRKLFLVVESVEDKQRVFRTSYGWFMAATPFDREQVVESIAACRAQGRLR